MSDDLRDDAGEDDGNVDGLTLFTIERTAPKRPLF